MKQLRYRPTPSINLFLPESDECEGTRRCCENWTHRKGDRHCYHWDTGLRCCRCGSEKAGNDQR